MSFTPGIRTTENQPKQLTQTQICISTCIVGVLFLSRFVSLPTRIRCSISTTLGARRRANLRKDSCPERLTQVDHSPTRSRPPLANWPIALQTTDFSFVGWLHRVKLLLPCEPKKLIICSIRQNTRIVLFCVRMCACGHTRACMAACVRWVRACLVCFLFVDRHRH